MKPEVERVGDRFEYVGVRIRIGEEERVLNGAVALDIAETVMRHAKKVGEEAPPDRA